MSTDTVTVSWYTCDCEWITKYCDEEHYATAVVPKSVLSEYATGVVK